MALNETKPFARSARTIEAKALARASAPCLLACPLLILPPLPDVSSEVDPTEWTTEGGFLVGSRAVPFF
jgi:hypothetical protein